MKNIDELLQGAFITTSQAIELFDSLDVAHVELMIGRWRGREIQTEHPMVGYLGHAGWYGKIFEDGESVHPLLFYSRKGRSLYAVNPLYMPFTWRIPKGRYLAVMMRLAKPFFRTKKSKARLRMVEYRQKVSAAMVYDQKPIVDSFRVVDNDCLMGAMDLKGVKEPFFFLLQRDTSDLMVRL